MEDTFNVFQILKSSGNGMNFGNLVNTIFENLKFDVLTKSDELLLNLIFSDTTTQKDLDNFLSSWDIEVVGGHKALILSYFMKMHPELIFSEYSAPRLKGLIQFYRFRNLKLIANYKRICAKLHQSGIEFLIFKGGCIKYLRPEFSRVMEDIDILVHKKDYQKTAKIVKNLGYDISVRPHSIDVHKPESKEGIMDIHKYIVLESEKEKTFLPDLFKRATKQNVFGVETLVPSNEDLLFITLVNLVRNMRNKTSYSGIPYTLFDCKFLINSKPDFDWNIVIQNAKKTNTETHVYFAIQFINKIVPNLLPEKIKLDKTLEKEFKKYCTLLIYQRFYLWEMKQKGHEMKIKDLFSSKEIFIEYLKLKPKYFILKSEFIRKNLFLTKIILKKAGLFV